MHEYVLEMKGITKTFPGVIALDKVSLGVRKGEVHALIGENGAGKSTLMKILTGIYQANEGEIHLDGAKTLIRGVKDAQEKGLSIVSQEFNLINTLSIAENIFLGRFNGSGLVNWKELNETAKKLLDKLGFPFNVNAIVGRLGAAEKQLVEIAKALSFNARIIVMDEPTSSLTKNEEEMLFTIIRKLREDGITTIYISHKLEEIFRICDTVTVLRDGRVIDARPVSDVTRDEIIEKMVGRTVDMNYPKRSVVPGKPVMRVEKLGRRKLLKDISFELRKGEILGIAGLVGSGRTELAEALFGAAKISGGTISIGGKKVVLRSTRDGKDNSIGMLTENRKETGLVLDFSLAKNISITNLKKVANGIFLDGRKERDAARSFVEKLNIKTPSIGQAMVNLSGGNQQKVVLAKWLFSDVDILILDEPTRGIDVGAKYEIYCIMNKLVEEGKSIIMISSELPEVLGMSDRILVMHRGRINGELSGEGMSAEQVMQRAI
ncbi:MAG: sugar ABC transporter ATP-binding protein [Rectinemataceae bacterium]